MFLSANNTADDNVYVNMPAAFQGLFVGSSGPADPDAWRRIRYSDLASWRMDHEWDRNSIRTVAEISVDPDTLQLTFSAREPLPKGKVAPWIQTDLLGKGIGPVRFAGPLSDMRAKPIWAIDPRQPRR